MDATGWTVVIRLGWAGVTLAGVLSGVVGPPRTTLRDPRQSQMPGSSGQRPGAQGRLKTKATDSGGFPFFNLGPKKKVSGQSRGQLKINKKKRRR